MIKEKKTRVVIVGGVAGGASAAARLRRRDEFAEIILLEKGPDVSFANCGLPYYIGDEIRDRSRLSVQTPTSLAAFLNVDVRTRTEAIRIDRAAKTVRIRDLSDGKEQDLDYDKLVLAPGAAPLRPPLEGIDHPRIHTLRNLGDMDRIKEASNTASRILVVGGGFIGLEMAEQFSRLGKKVTLVEMMPQVLPQMDKDMTRLIEDSLRENGVDLILGDGIRSFGQASEGIEAVLSSGKRLVADLVLLSIGVRPESELARDADLELGERGHVRVGQWMQSSDPDIYAVGDVAESADPVLGGPAAVPLGGPANRQGRVAADHIVDGKTAGSYPGSIGTAIVRVFETAAAVTGWTVKRLEREGLPYREAVITDFNHASYYPDAIPLSVKVCWNPDDGRILGAQVVGVEGVDKRIDVLATAIMGRMNVDQIAHLELAYAPPFGSSKDPVNVAGFAAQNIRDGLLDPLYSIPESGEPLQIVDVRPKPLFDLCPTPDAINVPLGEMRKRLGDLDSSRPVATVCALGKTSYFAARILRQHGFDARGVVGGIRVCRDYSTPFRPPAPKQTEGLTPGTVRIDGTGLSCPGPILRLKEALRDEGRDSVFEIRATDPDFFRDLANFCVAENLHFIDLRREGGVQIARVAGHSIPEVTIAHGMPQGQG